MTPARWGVPGRAGGRARGIPAGSRLGPGTEPQRRSGGKGAQCGGCWQNVLKREGVGHTVEMLVAGVLYLLPVMWLDILTKIFEI